jgi:hypothetical protein
VCTYMLPLDIDEVWIDKFFVLCCVLFSFCCKFDSGLAVQ